MQRLFFVCIHRLLPLRSFATTAALENYNVSSLGKLPRRLAARYRKRCRYAPSCRNDILGGIRGMRRRVQRRTTIPSPGLLQFPFSKDFASCSKPRALFTALESRCLSLGSQFISRDSCARRAIGFIGDADWVAGDGACSRRRCLIGVGRLEAPQLLTEVATVRAKAKAV